MLEFFHLVFLAVLLNVSALRIREKVNFGKIDITPPPPLFLWAGSFIL